MQNIWFTPVAQTDSAASGQSDGTALNNTVTWNFDYFKLYTVGDAPAPTPTPTPVPETGDMLLIDDAMEYSAGASGSNNTLTQGDSQITQPNWGITTNTVSEDKSSFIVSQSRSSAYNNRFQIIQPDYYSMDKVTVFETQFKVKTQSGVYDGTEPQLGFIFDSEAAGYVTSTLGQIALSAETEDVWQKVRFIVNPSTRQVTIEINGTVAATANFASTAPTDVFGNMMFRLIALNNGVGVNDATADTEALTSPIEWTFDYFKTYQEDFPKETGDLLVIDDNMEYLDWGSSCAIRQDGHTIQYFYFRNEGQAEDPAKNAYVNDNTELVAVQSHTSHYQNRLNFSDYLSADGNSISLDNQIDIEATFKVAAASYTDNVPTLRLMFTWGRGADLENASNDPKDLFLDTSMALPLSAETADSWQTVKFTIDPETKTVTATLNGQPAGSATYSDTKKVLTNFWIGLVAESATTGAGADAAELGNTVTWTFDSFKISKPEEEVEPTPPSVYDPLAEAVSSGAFSSDRYEAGTGKDDTKQLFSKTISLGDEPAMINKIELDHDSSQIMSYSFEYSPDGLTYHPLTVAYPGEVDTYSGQQTFRFAPVPARFVRYNATLLEKKDTQARVNDVTISYVDTTELNLSALPGSVNPVLTDEVVLKAVATDSAQDTYAMPNEGVVWSIDDGAPDGVTLDGTSLRFAKTTAAGQVTVTATDASSDTVVSTKTIQIVPQVAARNFALYADEAGTMPITSLQAGSTVYARAEFWQLRRLRKREYS